MTSNVEEVFAELKCKGLIDKNRILFGNPITPNFQGLGPLINYNPRYGNLNKELAKFVLLHEEGHMKKLSRTYLCFMVYAFLIALFLVSTFAGVLLVPDEAKLYVHIFADFIFVSAFLLLWRIFLPFFKEDEFDADLWACARLYQEYSIKEPHAILKAALEEVMKIKPPKHVEIIFKILTFFLPKYHPSNEERYEYVKSYFENKKIS
jgi:Zn-dependent protease with chaperone function